MNALVVNYSILSGMKLFFFLNLLLGMPQSARFQPIFCFTLSYTTEYPLNEMSANVIIINQWEHKKSPVEQKRDKDIMHRYTGVVEISLLT